MSIKTLKTAAQQVFAAQRNGLLNRHAPTPFSTPTTPVEILVHNTSSTPLEAYHAVQLNLPTLKNSEDFLATNLADGIVMDVTYPTENTQDTTTAILQENIDVDSIGRAVLIGITPAILHHQPDHTYAKPLDETGILQSCPDATNIKILWTPENSDGETCGYVLLGFHQTSIHYGILRDGIDHFSTTSEDVRYVVDCQVNDNETQEMAVIPTEMEKNSPGFEWNLPAGTPVRVECGKIAEAFLPELWGDVTIEGKVENKTYTITLSDGKAFNGSETVEAWPAPNIPEEVEFEGLTPVVVKWNHAAGKWFFFVIRKGGTVSEWKYFSSATGRLRTGFLGTYATATGTGTVPLLILNAADDIAETTYYEVFAKKERVDVVPSFSSRGLSFFYKFVINGNTYWGNGEFYKDRSGGTYRVSYAWLPVITATITKTNGDTFECRWIPSSRFSADEPEYNYDGLKLGWRPSGVSNDRTFGYYYGDNTPIHYEYKFTEEEGLTSELVYPNRLDIYFNDYGTAINTYSGLGEYENCTVEAVASEFRSTQTSEYGEFPAVDTDSVHSIPAMNIGCLYYTARLADGKGSCTLYARMHAQSDIPDNVHDYQGNSPDISLFIPANSFWCVSLFPFLQKTYTNVFQCFSSSSNRMQFGRSTEWGGYYKVDNDASTAKWNASSPSGLWEDSKVYYYFTTGKCVLKWQPAEHPISSKTVTVQSILTNSLSQYPDSDDLHTKTNTAYKAISTGTALAAEVERKGGVTYLVNESIHPQRSGSDNYNSEKVFWIGLNHVDSCQDRGGIISSTTTAKYPHWIELSGDMEFTLKYKFIEFPDMEVSEPMLGCFLLG
ncbi:MAG: hypothetical protein Q4D62_13930, partial [Planctomycetia bacterium]|nr:hypothetical protein [Planctomycetia bacterium]